MRKWVQYIMGGIAALAVATVLGGCGHSRSTQPTAKRVDATVLRLDRAVDGLFSNDQHNLPAAKLSGQQIKAARKLYNQAVARGGKLTNTDVRLVNKADRNISKAKQFYAVTSGLHEALGASKVIVPDYNETDLLAAWNDVSTYSVFVAKYGEQVKLVKQEVAAVKLVQKLYDGTVGDVTNKNGTEMKNYSVKTNVTAAAVTAAKKAVAAVQVSAFRTHYMKYVDAAQAVLDAQAASSSSVAADSSSASASSTPDAESSSADTDDNGNTNANSSSDTNTSGGSSNSGYSSGYNSGYGSGYGYYYGSGNSGSNGGASDGATGSESERGGSTSSNGGSSDNGSGHDEGGNTSGASDSSSSSSDDTQYTGNWSGGI